MGVRVGVSLEKELLSLPPPDMMTSRRALIAADATLIPCSLQP
jgi:hypothetical protein